MLLPIPPKIPVYVEEKRSVANQDGELIQSREGFQSLQEKLAGSMAKGDWRGAGRKVLDQAMAAFPHDLNWMALAVKSAAVHDQLPAVLCALDHHFGSAPSASREPVDELIALGAGEFQRWCGGDSRTGVFDDVVFCPSMLKWALERRPALVAQKDSSGLSVLACACLNDTDDRPFEWAMAAGEASVRASAVSSTDWSSVMASAAVLMAQKEMNNARVVRRLEAMEAAGFDWRAAVDEDGLSVFGAAVLGVQTESIGLALLSCGASPQSAAPRPDGEDPGRSAIEALLDVKGMIWFYKTLLAKQCLAMTGDNELRKLVASGKVPARVEPWGGKGPQGYMGSYQSWFSIALYERLAAIEEAKELGDGIAGSMDNKKKRLAL